MEVLEILDKIEDIIENQSHETAKDDKNQEEGTQEKKSSVKDVTNLLLSFLLSILKAPFQLVAKYLKNEIISTIKKDARLYALIMGLMGVMFVFFVVLWLFISVIVGVYFYESGKSILISISYSIGFQIISFAIVGIIAFSASKKVKSLKLLKNGSLEQSQI